MSNEECISRLFRSVLFREITENGLSHSEVRDGIRTLTDVYGRESTTFDSCLLRMPDFGDPACRCAYLFKYASLHTHVVLDATLRMLRTHPGPFRELRRGDLELCSLGGGPGSDVVGVLAALRVKFGPLDASVTIVDVMGRWRKTFAYVLRELEVGRYGAVWRDVDRGCDWDYIEHNLLGPMSNDVNRAVAAASLVTMVKFVSAAACADTENMVDKIFRVMKVGALVLYIDNAAGGFTQLIERSGKRNGLVPVVGPLKHVQYDAETLKIQRFGYNSCYQTKVTIILLQKVQHLNLNREIPTARLQANPRKDLDFVVYEHCRHDPGNQLPPQDVNVFSPNLNTSGADKYPEKLMNNLKASPAKSSLNAVRSLQDFYGTSAAIPPFKSNPVVSPPESNPVFPQATNHASPRKPNPTFPQATNPVSPRKSNPAFPQSTNYTSPRKSNPTFPPTPNRVSPRNSNPTFSQTPNYVSQPVYRAPAAAQRYQPVWSVENNTPPEEQSDDSEEAGCSCCVIS